MNSGLMKLSRAIFQEKKKGLNPVDEFRAHEVMSNEHALGQLVSIPLMNSGLMKEMKILSNMRSLVSIPLMNSGLMKR